MEIVNIAVGVFIGGSASSLVVSYVFSRVQRRIERRHEAMIQQLRESLTTYQAEGIEPQVNVVGYTDESPS